MSNSPDGDLTYNEDSVLSGRHRGGVRVNAGTLVMAGNLQGSLVVETGANAVISGHQQGSVHVPPGSTVTVTGRLDGSAHVEPGGVLLVEASGRHAGSLHNDGTVIVRGSFGGSSNGSGEFRLEDQGYVKQPVVKNGINYYQW